MDVRKWSISLGEGSSRRARATTLAGRGARTPTPAPTRRWAGRGRLDRGQAASAEGGAWRRERSARARPARSSRRPTKPAAGPRRAARNDSSAHPVTPAQAVRVAFLGTDVCLTVEAVTPLRTAGLAPAQSSQVPPGTRLARRATRPAIVKDKLRVLLLDARAERARDLARTLEDAGCQVVARLHAPVDLHATLRRIEPELVIVDMDSPDRDTLEDMQRITSEQPRPIVMFVDESDSESIRTAVRAGVAGYVVKGASPDRIRPVLEVAVARFEEFQALRNELARAQSTLAERKTIERAQGILMEKRGFSEEEAFRMLRKMAMNQGVRLAEVARHVLAAAEII